MLAGVFSMPRARAAFLRTSACSDRRAFTKTSGDVSGRAVTRASADALETGSSESSNQCMKSASRVNPRYWDNSRMAPIRALLWPESALRNCYRVNREPERRCTGDIAISFALRKDYQQSRD